MGSVETKRVPCSVEENRMWREAAGSPAKTSAISFGISRGLIGYAGLPENVKVLLCDSENAQLELAKELARIRGLDEEILFRFAHLGEVAVRRTILYASENVGQIVKNQISEGQRSKQTLNGIRRQLSMKPEDQYPVLPEMFKSEPLVEEEFDYHPREYYRGGSGPRYPVMPEKLWVGQTPSWRSTHGRDYARGSRPRIPKQFRTSKGY